MTSPRSPSHSPPTKDAPHFRGTSEDQPSPPTTPDPISPFTDAHAPPNSHGTYLEFYADEGLEALERYEAGGYHPVYLGDRFGAEGRYRVIDKLGYGGFGTVWLCRDDKAQSYVALKVMVSQVASEDKIFELKLAQLDRSTPGWEYLAMLLDHFTVTGPNGTHHCLVLPVLGPRVSPDLLSYMEQGTDTAPVLRRMARQATQAMGFLHKHGICHGDFRAANVLVKLKGIDLLSEEELTSLLGDSNPINVCSESGELPPGQPKYLVQVVDLTQWLGRDYLSDDVCVVDFGESYYFEDPPMFLGMPENYLPPEELLLPEVTGEEQHTDEDDDFRQDKAPRQEVDALKSKDDAPQQKSQVHMAVKGPACDLWALGCALYEIRRQMPLFYMIPTRDELLADMVRLLGKLPEPMWSQQWEARKEWFDDDGNCLVDDEQISLEMFMAPQEDDQGLGGVQKKIIFEEERKLLADLVRSLLRYPPAERISVEEALAHDWFKFTGGSSGDAAVAAVTEPRSDPPGVDKES